MKMKQFFPIKLTAWALSLFMLLSSMGDGGILYAAQSPVLYEPSAQFNLNELQVPEQFGEVSEKSEGENNKPAVILIQDAHAIPDAQKNIHALIRHFEKKYGVKNVALEGASSELDPQFFRSFPDQKLLKKIFKDYYERSELSGAAAASVFAGTDVRFQGVEDWPLYEQALLDYLRALESESLVLARVKGLKADLNLAKQKNYSPDLLKADRAWEAFEENQTQILETIKVLASIRKPAAGSLIELLMRVEPQGEHVQGQDLELKAAVEVVRSGLDKNPSARKNELMELNRCLQAYQTGEMNAQEFAVRIKKLAEGLGLAVQFSRPLRELSAMQMRLESMRGTKLLKEFEVYAADIKHELIERETDLLRKEAIRLTEKQNQKIRLIEKLARLELSHDEWNQIQSIRRGSSEGEEGERRLIDWNLLEANLSFYENSVEREKAFIRNVRKLLPNPSRDLHPVIFVAGGFHTQGMAERFKKEGLSYAVVTPKIERLPEVNSYRKHMAGDVSWKSYFKFEGNRVRPYDAFARSVRDQLLSQDLDAAKVWRDEIIRDLADQGRAQDAWKYTKFIDETQSRDGRRNLSLREGVAERLSRRVDQFVSGLKSLYVSGNFNQKSIASLLRSMNAVDGFTGPAAMDPTASIAMRALSGPDTTDNSRRPRTDSRRSELRTLDYWIDAKLLKKGSYLEAIRKSVEYVQRSAGKHSVRIIYDADTDLETLQRQLGLNGQNSVIWAAEATVPGSERDPVQVERKILDEINQEPLKYLSALRADESPEAILTRYGLPEAPLVFANIQTRELELAAQTISILLQNGMIRPIVIAPRNPEDGERLGELLAAQPIHFQSKGGIKGNSGILILDTMGDLAAILQTAPLSIYGNTLMGESNRYQMGMSHNLAESFGVVTGMFSHFEKVVPQSVNSSSRAVAEYRKQGAVVEVGPNPSPENLATAIEKILRDPQKVRDLKARSLLARKELYGQAVRYLEIKMDMRLGRSESREEYFEPEAQPNLMRSETRSSQVASGEAVVTAHDILHRLIRRGNREINPAENPENFLRLRQKWIQAVHQLLVWRSHYFPKDQFNVELEYMNADGSRGLTRVGDLNNLFGIPPKPFDHLYPHFYEIDPKQMEDIVNLDQPLALSDALVFLPKETIARQNLLYLNKALQKSGYQILGDLRLAGEGRIAFYVSGGFKHLPFSIEQPRRFEQLTLKVNGVVIASEEYQEPPAVDIGTAIGHFFIKLAKGSSIQSRILAVGRELQKMSSRVVSIFDIDGTLIGTDGTSKVEHFSELLKVLQTGEHVAGVITHRGIVVEKENAGYEGKDLLDFNDADRAELLDALKAHEQFQAIWKDLEPVGVGMNDLDFFSTGFFYNDGSVGLYLRVKNPDRQSGERSFFETLIPVSDPQVGVSKLISAKLIHAIYAEKYGKSVFRDAFLMMVGDHLLFDHSMMRENGEGFVPKHNLFLDKQRTHVQSNAKLSGDTLFSQGMGSVVVPVMRQGENGMTIRFESSGVAPQDIAFSDQMMTPQALPFVDLPAAILKVLRHARKNPQTTVITIPPLVSRDPKPQENRSEARSYVVAAAFGVAAFLTVATGVFFSIPLLYGVGALLGIGALAAAGIRWFAGKKTQTSLPEVTPSLDSGAELKFEDDEWQAAIQSGERLGLLEIYFKDFFDGKIGLSPSYFFTEQEYRDFVAPFLEKLDGLVQVEEDREGVLAAFTDLNHSLKQQPIEILYWLAQKLEATPRYRKPSWDIQAVREVFLEELFGLFRDLLVWMEPGQQSRKELQDLRGSMELAIETLGQKRLSTFVYPVEWNDLPGLKDAGASKRIQALQLKAGQSLDIDRGNLNVVGKYFKELAAVNADLNAYLERSSGNLKPFETYRVAYSVLLALFFLHDNAKLEAERIVPAFTELAETLHQKLEEINRDWTGATDVDLNKFDNLPAARAAIDMLEDLHPTPTTMSRFVLSLMIRETELIKNGDARGLFRSEARIVIARQTIPNAVTDELSAEQIRNAKGYQFLSVELKQDLAHILSMVPVSISGKVRFSFYPFWHPGASKLFWMDLAHGHARDDEIRMIVPFSRGAFRRTLIHELTHVIENLTGSHSINQLSIRHFPQENNFTGSSSPRRKKFTDRSVLVRLARVGQFFPSFYGSSNPREYAAELAALAFFTDPKDIMAKQNPVISPEQYEIISKKIFKIPQNFYFLEGSGRSGTYHEATVASIAVHAFIVGFILGFLPAVVIGAFFEFLPSVSSGAQRPVQIKNRIQSYISYYGTKFIESRWRYLVMSVYFFAVRALFFLMFLFSSQISKIGNESDSIRLKLSTIPFIHAEKPHNVPEKKMEVDLIFPDQIVDKHEEEEERPFETDVSIKKILGDIKFQYATRRSEIDGAVFSMVYDFFGKKVSKKELRNQYEKEIGRSWKDSSRDQRLKFLKADALKRGLDVIVLRDVESIQVALSEHIPVLHLVPEHQARGSVDLKGRRLFDQSSIFFSALAEANTVVYDDARDLSDEDKKHANLVLYGISPEKSWGYMRAHIHYLFEKTTDVQPGDENYIFSLVPSEKSSAIRNMIEDQRAAAKRSEARKLDWNDLPGIKNDDGGNLFDARSEARSDPRVTLLGQQKRIARWAWSWAGLSMIVTAAILAAFARMYSLSIQLPPIEAPAPPAQSQVYVYDGDDPEKSAYLFDSKLNLPRFQYPLTQDAPGSESKNQLKKYFKSADAVKRAQFLDTWLEQNWSKIQPGIDPFMLYAQGDSKREIRHLSLQKALWIINQLDPALYLKIKERKIQIVESDRLEGYVLGAAMGTKWLQSRASADAPPIIFMTPSLLNHSAVLSTIIMEHEGTHAIGMPMSGFEFFTERLSEVGDVAGVLTGNIPLEEQRAYQRETRFLREFLDVSPHASQPFMANDPEIRMGYLSHTFKSAFESFMIWGLSIGFVGVVVWWGTYFRQRNKILSPPSSKPAPKILTEDDQRHAFGLKKRGRSTPNRRRSEMRGKDRSEARKLDWNDNSSATSDRLNRFVAQIKRNKILWPQANHPQSLLAFEVEESGAMELTSHTADSHRSTRLPGQLLLVRPGAKVLNDKDFVQLEKEPTHTLRRAQGALGWIRVSEMTLDGEPALYISEVQSSAGFHALWKRFVGKKDNLRWAPAVVKSIAQAAQATGYKIIIAKNHRTARLENPNRPGSDKTWQLISDGALQEVYKRPFKGWQETEIEHSTGWKTTAWIKELKEPLALTQRQSQLIRWWYEMLAKLKPLLFKTQVKPNPEPAVVVDDVTLSLKKAQGEFLDQSVVQVMRAAISNKKNLNQIMGAFEFPITKSGTRLRLHKTILGLGAFEIEMKAPGQEDWVTLPMSRLNFKEKSDEIILDDIAIDNEFKFVGQGMGSTLFAYLHEYARITQKSIRIPSTENYWLGFAVYKNWGRDATYEAPDRTRQPLREVYANPPKEIIVEIHYPVRERPVFKYQNGAYVRQWEPWMESGDTLSLKLELSWDAERLVLKNPVADARFSETQYSMYWPQSIVNIVIQPKAPDGRSETRVAPKFVYTDEAGRKRIKVDLLPEGITKRFLQSLIQSNSHKKVFIVGGAVRDLIMGQEPNDVDVLTDSLDFQGIPSEFEGMRVADMGDFERRGKGVSFDRADFLQKPELSINRLLIGFDDKQDPYLEEEFSPQGYDDLLSGIARIMHAETRQSYFTISLMAPRLVEKIKKYNLTFDSETKQILEAVLRSQSAFLEIDRAEMTDTDLEVYDALKTLQEILSSVSVGVIESVEKQVRSEMRLVEDSKAEIEVAIDQAGGVIPYAQFQELALYGKHGYYSAGGVQFSELGTDDVGVEFHTNAHLPAVGLALADHFYQVWKTVGRPEKFDVVELSGGDGSMALNVLQPVLMYEDRYPDAFWKSLHYKIVERNQVLIDRQQTKLKGLHKAMGSRLEFVHESALKTNLPEKSVSGVIFSNELPDAFAVHRVVVRDGKLKEIYVGYNESGFYEKEGDLSPSAKDEIEAYFKLVGGLPPEGKEFAVNLAMNQLMAEISKILKQGIVLTMDYGFEKTSHRFESDTVNSVWTFGDRDGEPPLKLGVDTTHNIDFQTLQKMGKTVGLNDSEVSFLPHFLGRFGFVGSTANPQEYVLTQARGLDLSVFQKKRSEMRELERNNDFSDRPGLPIQSDLFVDKQVYDLISSEDRALVEGVLSFGEQAENMKRFGDRGVRAIGTSGDSNMTRSLIIPLEKPIVVKGVMYNAAIVKGIRLDPYDDESVRQLPLKAAGQPLEKVDVRDGRIVYAPSRPQAFGGMPWAHAEDETAAAQFLHSGQSDFQYSAAYPLAKGKITNKHLQLENEKVDLGYELQLIQAQRLNTDRYGKVPYDEVRAHREVIDQVYDFERFLISGKQDKALGAAAEVNKVIQKSAEMLRKMQAIGKHGSFNLTNIAVWNDESFALRDLTHFKRWENIQTFEDRFAYAFLDFKTLILGYRDAFAAAARRAQQMGISEEDEIQILKLHGKLFFDSFIDGYFSPQLRQDARAGFEPYLLKGDFEGLSVKLQKISDLGTELRLVDLDDPIIQLLYRELERSLKTVKRSELRFEATDNFMAWARDFKKQYSEEIAVILAKPDSEASLEQKSKELGALTDKKIGIIFNLASTFVEGFAGHEQDWPMALVATGTYARNELARGSDRDGLILYPRGADEESYKPLLDYFYYAMLNGLNFAAGWPQIASDDIETRNLTAEEMTEMIDARPVAGSETVVKEFNQKYHRYLQSDFKNPTKDPELEDIKTNIQFLIQHLIKFWHENRVKRGFYDGIFDREPNLKWGSGGFRDMDFSRWILQIMDHRSEDEKALHPKMIAEEEMREAKEAYRYLRTVRWMLHEERVKQKKPLTEKTADILSFEFQQAIADQLYPEIADPQARLEKMVSKLQSSSQTLYLFSSNIFRRALHQTGSLNYTPLGDDGKPKWVKGLEADGIELVKRTGKTVFLDTGLKHVVDQVTLTIHPDHVLKSENILKLLQYAVEHKLAMTGELLDEITRRLPDFSQWVGANPESSRAQFLKLRETPQALGYLIFRMHALELLEDLIPAFGEISSKATLDIKHREPLDIYAIKSLGALDQILGLKFWEDKPHALAEKVQSEAEFIKNKPEFLRLIRDALLVQPLADFMPDQVQDLIKQLGYGEESQKSNLVWLIENRDALINFIRRGGMNDPQMFKEFRDQKLEGDYQRWVLLLLLTVTRMDFFNPGRKKIFSEVLQPLMGLTEDQFKNDKEIQNRFSQTQHEIQQLADEGSSAASGKQHKTSVDLALRFIEGSDQFLQVDVVLDPHWNRPGTLLRIAAAFVKHNLSVQNMQIGLVRNGATGDRFIVKLRNPVDAEEMAQVEEKLQTALREDIKSLIVDPTGKSYQAYLEGRSKAYVPAKPSGPISLEVTAETGKKSTFIHLKMEDGPEILFNIARLFERYGLNIMDKSTLDTEGVAEDYKGLRVVDTFEVQKNEGPLDEETIKALIEDMNFLFSSSNRDAAFQNLPSRRSTTHKKIYAEIDELFRVWQSERQYQSYNVKEMEFYFPFARRFFNGRYKSLRNYLDAFYRVTAPWIEELGYADRYDYFRRQVSSLEVGLASSNPYLKDAVRLGDLPPIMTESGVDVIRKDSLPYWADFSRDLNQFIGAMLDHVAQDLGQNFNSRPLFRSEFRILEIPALGRSGEARTINRLVSIQEPGKKVQVADFISALKQYLQEKQKNQNPAVQFEIGDSFALALRDAITRASAEDSVSENQARRISAQMIFDAFGVDTAVDDVAWTLFNAGFWDWLLPDWKILKRQNDGDISPHQYYTARHLVQVLMNSERLAFVDTEEETYAPENVGQYEREFLLEYQKAYRLIAGKGASQLASFRLGELFHDIGKAKEVPTAYAPSHMVLGAQMLPPLFKELQLGTAEIPSWVAMYHQYLNAVLADVLAGRKTFEQMLLELADLPQMNLDYLNMLFMVSMADYLGVFRIPGPPGDVRGLLREMGLYGQSLQSIYSSNQEAGFLEQNHAVMKLVQIRREMESYLSSSSEEQVKIRQKWEAQIQADQQKFKDELAQQGIHPDVLAEFPAWYLMRLHFDAQKRDISNVVKLDRFYRKLIHPEIQIGNFTVKNGLVIRVVVAFQRVMNQILNRIRSLFLSQMEWLEDVHWNSILPMHLDTDLYSIHDNRYMNVWIGLPEDRPGLLAAMTAALARRKLNVQQVFVKTINGKVFNHFLVSYKSENSEGDWTRSEDMQDQVESFLREDIQTLMRGDPALFQERLNQYYVDQGIQSFGRQAQEGDQPRIEVEFKNLDGQDVLTYEMKVQSDRDQPWFLHRLTHMIAAMRGNILSNAQILTRDRGEIDNRLVVSFPDRLSDSQMNKVIELMRRGLTLGISTGDFINNNYEISKLISAKRSEARGINIEEAEAEFRRAVEAAGFVYRQDSIAMTEKGVNKATPYEDNYFTAFNLPISKETKRIKIVDAGSGQGWAVLRMAHVLELLYPDKEFEFVGIEFEENLVQEAGQILKKAEESRFIGKSKISFVQGDFTHSKFYENFESADFVYYYSDGTTSVDRLAGVLAQHLKAGSHVVEYPYDHLDEAMDNKGRIRFVKEAIYHPDEFAATEDKAKVVPVFHLYAISLSGIKGRELGVEVDASKLLEKPTQVGSSVIAADDGETFEVKHTLLHGQHAVSIYYKNQQIGFAHFTINKEKSEHAIMENRHAYGDNSRNTTDAIWVNPEFQDRYQGIDVSLMAKSFEIAQAAGVPGFRVPHSLNDKFYKSLGMQDFLNNGDFWIPLEPEQMLGWKISIPDIQIKLRKSEAAKTPANIDAKADSTKRSEARYPDPVVDTQSKDLAHYSYLERYQKQWVWIKENALEDMVRRARKDAKNSSRPELNVTVMGASTGEEIARTFHEIVAWLEGRGEKVALSENENGWRIKILGIEKNPEIAAFAEKRISGESPFWVAVSDEKSQGRQYARAVMETLNRFERIFKQSVQIKVDDVAQSASLNLPQPHLILANSVFYQIERGQVEKILRDIDEKFPQAWIAMTNDASYKPNPVKHSLLGSTNQGPADAQDYIFLAPLRSEMRKAVDGGSAAHDLLSGFQAKTLKLSANEADQQAGQILSDVEVVGLEEYLTAIQKIRDEMVASWEGNQNKQMQNLELFFADALLQNLKSEVEIALDAPDLETALQEAIQEFAFGDGVRFVLPKTMANLKVPATMVRRVNSLVSAVKKGAPVLLSIFSAGGEGASQKSESIVDLISDEDGLADFNDVQRQKADVLMRMLVAILLSGKVKSRDQMNNIPMLLTDAGYFQNIVQALTFKDGRLAVSMNVLMRLAQKYAATKQIQAAA